MIFDRNINGIQVTLRIDGYQDPAAHGYGDVWCDCGYSFRLADVLDYRCEHDELLMPEEVDALAVAFSDLLEGRLAAPREIRLMEPDFVFLLCPETDLRTDPEVIYVAPGCELQGIRAEWRVYFWNEGLTDHYLTIALGRDDIAAFRDFLLGCAAAQTQGEDE